MKQNQAISKDRLIAQLQDMPIVEVACRCAGVGRATYYRWLSVEQLNALDSTEIFENVREIGRYVLDRVYSDWERITPVASGSTN